ncbi:MAG: hypothetical protein F4Y72_07315 [Gammaproteobacteria bacterium]|nr:hypothetical protein [Gammaproteobacteria bacterium]
MNVRIAAMIVVLWPLVSWGQAGKPTVAIEQIATAAQNISCEGWDRSSYDCNADLSEGFRVMLETAIIKTGKMDVMERRSLELLLQEQGLGATGLSDAGGDIGGLIGVDYLVYGTITRFGQLQGGFSFGGIQSKELSVSMGIDLKVTDVSTGLILIADEIAETVQVGSSFSFGDVTQAQTRADPFAEVQRVVSNHIAEAIVTTRIPVKVIAVQSNGTLVLNYGDVLFSPGDQLAAFVVGETFVDPDTGEVLGADETPIGTVEISSAEARMSRASILDGDPSAFQVGVTLKRVVDEDDKGNKRKRNRSGRDW